MQQQSTEETPPAGRADSSVDASRATGRRVLVNTGSLASASLWRIFISFVLQVLITRLLGITEFGQYVSVLAYLNVSQVVCELGLPTLLARDLAQSSGQRRGYFWLALRLQVVMAFVAWAGLIGLTHVLPLSAGTRVALWFVGASLPFYAVTSASQTLFKACERMELVMGVETSINTLIMLLSIGVLMGGGGLVALVLVLVLTQAVSAGVCLLLLKRFQLLAEAGRPLNVTVRTLWPRARPFYWLALADVLLHRMDILLLNIVAGEAITGIYSVAYSLVRVIVKLVQSYWQALYPTLSRLHREAGTRYRQLAALGLRYGFLVVLPAAAIGTGVATELLALLYSEKAALSAPVFQILVWMTPFFLFETYAMTQLMIVRRPRRSLVITGCHIACVALLLPLLTRGYGASGAAIAILMAGAVGALIGGTLLKRISIPWYFSKTFPLVAATLAAGLLGMGLPLPWPVRGAVAFLVYFLLVWWTGVFAASDRALLGRALLPRKTAARSGTV